MSLADGAQTDAILRRLSLLERRIEALEGQNTPLGQPGSPHLLDERSTLTLKRGPGRPRKEVA